MIISRVVGARVKGAELGSEPGLGFAVESSHGRGGILERDKKEKLPVGVSLSGGFCLQWLGATRASGSPLFRAVIGFRVVLGYKTI